MTGTRIVKAGNAFSAVGKNTFSALTQSAADPNKTQGGTGVISPPFDVEKIMSLVNESSILPQCIQAMVEGCERDYTLQDADDEDGKDPNLEEWKRITSFLNSIDAEGQLSFLEIRRRTRKDKEFFGYAAWEIVRNTGDQVVGVKHIPANTIKLFPMDSERVEAEIKQVEDGKLMKMKVRRTFRKFIQEVAGKKVYFKEWGDPREMDCTTGDYRKSVEPEKKATEILFFREYNPATPYGFPKWIGTALEIAGVKAAAEVNYSYFDGNAIPAGLLMVSGGVLGEGADPIIQSFMDEATKGRTRQNSMLILEAVPMDNPSGNDKVPPVRMEFKSLRDAQQSDGQFLKYIQEGKDSIRSSFRLPPLLVGMASDYTRATAEESVRQAEEQVFNPERENFDSVMKRFLIQEFEMVSWRFETSSIDLSNPDEIEKLVRVGHDTASLGPNEIRKVIQKKIGLDLDPLSSEYGDLPFLAQQMGLATDESMPEGIMKSLWALKKELDSHGEIRKSHDCNSHGH